MKKSSYSFWFRAFTLRERKQIIDNSLQLNNTFNNTLAEERLLAWRQQLPFNEQSYFQSRLELDGLDLEMFTYILGQTEESIDLSNKLTECYSKSYSIETLYSKYYKAPNQLYKNPRSFIGFLKLVQPLIDSAYDNLEKQVKQLNYFNSQLPFNSETVVDILGTNLPGKLFEIISPTLVLELNIARLKGILTGATPKERYLSFEEHISKPDIAIKILQEYPVMARLVDNCLEQWVSFSLKFLNDLCEDWNDMQVMFNNGSSLGNLKRINPTGSDSHRGGQTVLLVYFESGTIIVYKPRNLGIDIHFQSILGWINNKKIGVEFKRISILSGKNHGWEEYIVNSTCTSHLELSRFYERQGAYLALLFSLEATDFHFENVIAAGEHPYLIDLEALFHPRLHNKITTDSIAEKSFSVMSNSVLRVGLLPRRVSDEANINSIDLSGLGAFPGQLASGVAYWSQVGTDEMHKSFKTLTVPRGHNRPLLNNKDVNTLEFSENIITGFKNMYEFLLQNREEFLSDTGPLHNLLKDEIRVVVRPTRSYGLIRRKSYHPDVLRNALDRDKLLDLLWVSVPKSPRLSSVISFEQNDLNVSDIPLFTSRVNSRNLWSSQGDLLKDFFDESGIESVKKRLRSFNAQDMAQQIWFIKSSLATLVESDHSSHKPFQSSPKEATQGSSEMMIGHACLIGDRLHELAKINNDKAIWFGISHLNRQNWTIHPSGLDLYNGVSGIALFLAYLGKITKNSKYSMLAQAATNTMIGELQKDQLINMPIGAFNGVGSLIYTLSHLSKIWNQPDYNLQAEKIIFDKLILNINKDTHLDIIGGVSGCILAILSCYRQSGSLDVLQVAIQCGDYLIQQSEQQDIGIAWNIPIDSTAPLLGFGHGNTGIVYALSELAHVSGECRFNVAVQQGIQYEDSLFSLKAGNWPDLRVIKPGLPIESSKNKYMTAWCHGAPGIILARMYMNKFHKNNLPHYITDTTLNAALDTTLRHGLGQSHCLCHGDLGNIEAISFAATYLGASWKEHETEMKSIIATSINSDGWNCGVPLDIETPGLMTGLAGIGFGFLRLAKPDEVPSVLLLRPASACIRGHKGV